VNGKQQKVSLSPFLLSFLPQQQNSVGIGMALYLEVKLRYIGDAAHYCRDPCILNSFKMNKMYMFLYQRSDLISDLRQKVKVNVFGRNHG